MSLQLRLTLAIAALIAVLALTAVAGLSALTDGMRRALGDTATIVGNTLVTVLREEHRMHRPAPDGHGGGDDAADGRAEPARAETIVLSRGPQDGTRVVVNGRELSPEELAAVARSGPLARDADEALAQLPKQFRVEMHREDGRTPALYLHGIGSGAMATRIPIPAQQADAAVDGFRRQLWWGLAALLLLGTAGAALLARHIVRPLKALAAASEQLGHGALDARVEPQGPPELRRSIDAFNRMAGDLARLQAEAAARRDDRELAELGEIGRGLAHSLRNPLHALGLSLDALAARGGDDARAAALAQNGREQLARIDQALRGFLALSASSGAAEEDVDIDALLDDVVLEASQRAQGRLRFERSRRGLQLRGVAAELRIMLHALLINAVEASPDEGMVGIAVERNEEDGEGLRISIDDEGSGVPPALRERLFQPHVSSKPAGAGMGLYLAARLARQRYRGALLLHDRAPRGTRAELRLQPRLRPGDDSGANA